jgi:predicted deacetylase
MKFIIRWDDISPFQDEGKFFALIDLFTKHNIPAVLGVVPDNQDEIIKVGRIAENRYIETLQGLSQSGWEIALHGFRHRRHTPDSGILGLNSSSEFAGRPYEDQLADLRQGKRQLEENGFEIQTFVPPWHSYDENTLKALIESSFEVLSDGLHLYPRLIDGLLSLPVLFWAPPRRIRTLQLLDSVYTICVHPQLVTKDELLLWERFFTEERPEVVTAWTVIADKENIARGGLKRRLFETIFSSRFRKA